MARLMIGNPKKLELIKYRKETLEQMKELAWQMSCLPENSISRPAFVETLRVFGQIARETKEKIEKES